MRPLKVAAVAGLILLGGCSMFDTARQTVATKGAELMDKVANDGEWAVCYGASIGAIRRRYGGSEERAATYRAFCKQSNAKVLAPAE